jgi:Holliday junction resolvasome RuvABC endonuclease subunit
MKKTKLKYKRILALDLSLAATGFAQNYPSAITFGTLKPPKKMIGMERLDWILEQIPHEDAEIVIMEDLAFAAHDRNHERAGLATMVRHALWLRNIPYVLVAPTSLKKATSGSGKAEKSQMTMVVFKRWGFEAKNDNESDAISLLMLGMYLTGEKEPATKAEQEVLKTVRASNAEALKCIGL